MSAPVPHDLELLEGVRSTPERYQLKNTSEDEIRQRNQHAASGCLHSATSAILRTRTWVDGQPVAQKRALRICAPHRLLRATWMAHELLTTFEAKIGGVTLVPGSEESSTCPSMVRPSGREQQRAGSLTSKN